MIEFYINLISSVTIEYSTKGHTLKDYLGYEPVKIIISKTYLFGLIKASRHY